MAAKGEFLLYGKGDRAVVVRVEDVTETHARCRSESGAGYTLDLSAVDGLKGKVKAMKRLKAPRDPKAWPQLKRRGA